MLPTSVTYTKCDNVDDVKDINFDDAIPQERSSAYNDYATIGDLDLLSNGQNIKKGGYRSVKGSENHYWSLNKANKVVLYAMCSYDINFKVCEQTCSFVCSKYSHLAISIFNELFTLKEMYNKKKII